MDMLRTVLAGLRIGFATLLPNRCELACGRVAPAYLSVFGRLVGLGGVFQRSEGLTW
jgi:hypothetical protein